MRSKVAQGAQVLRKVCKLLAVTDIKPPIGVIAHHVLELDRVSGRLSEYVVMQDESDRAFRAAALMARTQARELRQAYMMPIAQMGKTLFREDLAIRHELSMPHGIGYERQIAAARSMARHCAERRDRYVAAGFEPDFVEQLDKAADEVERLVDLKTVELGRRTSATAGMLAELARGRDLVRLLDSMVGTWLAKHRPEKLAEWKLVTRFARSGSVAKDVTPTAPVTPTGPQVSSTTSTTEAHAA